jgi:hypothetical protein
MPWSRGFDFRAKIREEFLGIDKGDHRGSRVRGTDPGFKR